MMNEIKEFDVDGLEELEDFETNEEITYLVCALGYSEAGEHTDCEVYLEEFEDGELLNKNLIPSWLNEIIFSVPSSYSEFLNNSFDDNFKNIYFHRKIYIN